MTPDALIGAIFATFIATTMVRAIIAELKGK